jgi:predicted cupin superfamily sugar epimerase
MSGAPGSMAGKQMKNTTPPKTAETWIRELALERHPEGGWYRRVYASEMRTVNGRPVMTSIYYLLEGSDFSALHRLQSDEQWHFYAGDPLTLHLIHPGGTGSEAVLRSGGPLQFTVKAGQLFGATVDGDYALVGCTVAPGFDFSEFEMPSRDALLRAYPEYGGLIRRLTRS